VREEKRYEKNQAQVSGCTVGASQTGWANLSSSSNGDKFIHSFKVKLVQEWSIQEWSSCFKHASSSRGLIMISKKPEKQSAITRAIIKY
jgi:hypothetical protein